METRGSISHSEIMKAIKILRNITLAVKVVPFVYAGIYILCMLAYLFCSDETATIVDMLFYVSPITCMLLFFISYILEFCNWYRLQCVLPILPTCNVFVDEYIYTYGQEVAIVNILLAGLIFTLSLVNTYFVFLKK